ncbi:DUF3566 domain-containing protein [Rhodococcus sp. WMMA185]|uniref:DUF3566 domain-containing protein n=1 Tax=Rhodococcus sp. WMMA185 TaxID=679318 RepID=UPI0008786AB9|nr:DUF3566 domain-containing protein [Rhodococcus sp. WMMA185]
MPPPQGHPPNQHTQSRQVTPPQAPGNRAPASGDRTVTPQASRGNPVPPWQREVQREPQTNLKRPVLGANAKQASHPEAQTTPAPAEGRPAVAKAPSGQDVQKPQSAQAPSQTAPTQDIQGQGMQQAPWAQNSGAPTQTATVQPAANPESMAATAAIGGEPGPATVGPVSQREAAKAKASAIDGPTRHINRDVLPQDLPDLSEAKHPLPADASADQKPKVVVAPQRVEEGGLRASVQIRRLDPWSTLKISSIISVSLFFVWMVAVGLLYLVLEGMGVWDRLNSAFTDIVADSSPEGLVTAGQVFGYAAVIGLSNMVLFTALATIGSFIYNLCSDLVGGVEVTLADRD